MPQTLLIFPIDMDATFSFAQHARMLGYRIIGASSVSRDGSRFPVDQFIHLPYVTAPEFEAALRQALDTHAIDSVYTLHDAVWARLQDLRDNAGKGFDFRLCGVNPELANASLFQPSIAWAEQWLADPFLAQNLAAETVTMQPPLSRFRYASLHYQFSRIPGQTDYDKLAVLCALVRCLPPGDLIEVGSLYGRSAYALAFLAQCHRIGSLICVDPWDAGKIVSQGETAALLNRSIPTIDLNRIFAGFLTAVGGFTQCGYIRDLSTAAASQYQSAAQHGHLHCAELGEVPVTGEIALLHIDANHHYTEVSKDIQTWTPFLKPGGWVVIDDYLWVFGDGPKRAGDELIATGAYDLAFVASDSLFARKR